MAKVSMTPISPSLELGESPHWIESEKALIFVDCPGGKIYKHYSETKRQQVLEFDNLQKEPFPIGPSVVIPIEGDENKFITGIGHDLSVVNWKASDADVTKARPTMLTQFELDLPKNSLNDAKCDSLGRLWAGTFTYPNKNFESEKHLAAVYKVDSNLKKEMVADKMTIGNGMTWSLDNKYFFFNDSAESSVYVFDFDLEKGEISNQRSLYDMKKLGIQDQFPDGMTIDQNGHLWIALYNGGKVICIDSTSGHVIREVDIPSLYTTSCCFGGPDYSTLFVTTAARDLKAKDFEHLPDSGKTFEIKGLGTKGFSQNCFKIDSNLLKGI